MGIYGNMIHQKDILSFVIQESENFNYIHELELVEELSKKFSVSIKERIIKLFDMFIEFCQKIINNIKRIFGKKVIETNKKRAIEVSKKIEHIEKAPEVDKETEQNEQRKEFTKNANNFLYKVYSNKYVLVDTTKLVAVDSNMYNEIFQNIKEILEKEFQKSKNINDKYGAEIDYKLISKIDVSNRDVLKGYRSYNYISSDLVQSKLGDIKDVTSIDKTKNLIESELDRAASIDKNKRLYEQDLHLWDQTHFNNGSISIITFPEIYAKYCDKANENIKFYTEQIEEFKNTITKLKTVVLKFTGHDYDDDSKFKHLNYKFHYNEDYVRVIERFIKTLNFNILYLNYMIELNMKGISSGASLIATCEKVVLN